jgi:hypothetical protein
MLLNHFGLIKKLLEIDWKMNKEFKLIMIRPQHGSREFEKLILFAKGGNHLQNILIIYV